MKTIETEREQNKYCHKRQKEERVSQRRLHLPSGSPTLTTASSVFGLRRELFLWRQLMMLTNCPRRDSFGATLYIHG